jgi:hypothetical protein
MAVLLLINTLYEDRIISIGYLCDEEEKEEETKLFCY